MEKEIKQLETALNELYKSNDVTRAAYSTLKFGVEQVKNCSIPDVSSCYAVFDEEDNIVQLYQTQEKASKGMEEFKRSHEHTEFYVDTMQIN